MHLIGPLAAGIDGCESGTFSIVQRGTSTPANYYTDFEGLTVPIIGTDVALDARGGGIFYVNELVKVTARSSGGVTIREFIAGDAGTAVEVRSDSFTGEHYQTAAIAAGNPTTLAAVLDKWNNSAGAIDWKVNISGVATDLDDAFASVAGQRLFVVTSYGAVGDGVTNDLSAINAAVSAGNAAGGGVVYFPPGTYLISGAITNFATVSWLGAGRALTTIKRSTNGAIVSGNLPARMSDFAVAWSVTHTTTAIQETTAAASSTKVIERIDFSASQGLPVSLQSSDTHRVQIRDCTFSVSGAFGAIVASNTTELEVDGCRAVFSGTSSVTGIAGASTANLRVTNCRLDFSAVTTGAKVGVSASTGTLFVSGCEFVPPTSATSWSCIQGTSNTVLVESGNALQSTASAFTSTFRCYAISNAAANQQVGSRSTLSAAPSDPNADPIVLPSNQAKFVRVNNTSSAAHSGNVGIRGEGSTTASMPFGSEMVLAVHNTTGGSVTYEWGSEFAAPTVTFAVANGTIRVFHFVLTERGGRTWTAVSDAAGAQS